MFIGENDYDLDMQVEEAREEGLAEGSRMKAVEDALMLI